MRDPCPGLTLQPQHSLPDVFIWMIADKKRIAYYRMPARQLLNATTEDQRGKHCGVMQTIFLRVCLNLVTVPQGYGLPEAPHVPMIETWNEGTWLNRMGHASQAANSHVAWRERQNWKHSQILEQSATRV